MRNVLGCPGIAESVRLWFYEAGLNPLCWAINELTWAWSGIPLVGALILGRWWRGLLAATRTSFAVDISCWVNKRLKMWSATTRQRPPNESFVIQHQASPSGEIISRKLLKRWYHRPYMVRIAFISILNAGSYKYTDRTAGAKWLYVWVGRLNVYSLHDGAS